MQEIVIIRACEEFIDSYHAALDAVASEKKYLSITRAFPFYQTELFIKDGVKNGYPYFFVVKDRKKVIGWCDIKPSENNRGYLGVAVLKKYRRQGIGKKLIMTALRAASEFGFSQVELDVRVSNHAAIELYKSIGFMHEKTICNGVETDGVKEDLFRMVFDFKIVCSNTTSL